MLGVVYSPPYLKALYIVLEEAVRDRPPIVFCNEFLFGSKYAGVGLLQNSLCAWFRLLCCFLCQLRFHRRMREGVSLMKCNEVCQLIYRAFLNYWSFYRFMALFLFFKNSLMYSSVQPFFRRCAP